MITKIFKIRKQRKMTQETLASLVGLTQGQITRIENGQTDIGLDQLSKFAKALNVRLIDLLPDEILPNPISPEEEELLKLFRKSKGTNNTEPETKAG